MTEHSIKDAIEHLLGLYPKADKYWPAQRQIAFRDKLKSIPIDIEQFIAAANHVAMETDAKWAPPESKLLAHLRGIVQSDVASTCAASVREVYGPQPGDRTLRGWLRHLDQHPEEYTQDELEGAAYLREAVNLARGGTQKQTGYCEMRARLNAVRKEAERFGLVVTVDEGKQT